MPLLRIPYTHALPPPKIIPPSASTTSGSIAALVDFLGSASPTSHPERKAVVLTGAGISTASGLADYRGVNGTYTLNRAYRPIYFHEFCESHEARKRYWARSFLGWTNLVKARPNSAHKAVGRLGELGVVGSCITQNVDSFHPTTHPSLPTIELHGSLAELVCLTCHSTYPRTTFQSKLSALNPTWSAFLEELLASGALDTENPDERRKKGLKTNPDGDVDIPGGAEYTTFRYPACPVCLAKSRERIAVDADGAWLPSSPTSSTSPATCTKTGIGILKPNVIMFGQSIDASTKLAAETAVDSCSRILVIGSSLATYSAWRLVKRAKDLGKPIGILNMGGVRGEEQLFAGVDEGNTGREAARCTGDVVTLLPKVVGVLEGMKRGRDRS